MSRRVVVRFDKGGQGIVHEERRVRVEPKTGGPIDPDPSGSAETVSGHADPEQVPGICPQDGGVGANLPPIVGLDAYAAVAVSWLGATLDGYDPIAGTWAWRAQVEVGFLSAQSSKVDHAKPDVHRVPLVTHWP